MVVLLSTSSVAGLYLGCILFGFGVGNLITLPGLIVQQEFPRRDFARAVSLNVAMTQLVAAVGPYVLGLLHDLSGNYRIVADRLPCPADRRRAADPGPAEPAHYRRLSAKEHRLVAGQHLLLVARRRPIVGSATPIRRPFGEPVEGRMAAGMLDHPGQVARIVGRQPELGARLHQARQHVEVGRAATKRRL